MSSISKFLKTCSLQNRIHFMVFEKLLESVDDFKEDAMRFIEKGVNRDNLSEMLNRIALRKGSNDIGTSDSIKDSRSVTYGMTVTPTNDNLANINKHVDIEKAPSTITNDPSTNFCFGRLTSNNTFSKKTLSMSNSSRFDRDWTSNLSPQGSNRSRSHYSSGLATSLDDLKDSDFDNLLTNFGKDVIEFKASENTSTQTNSSFVDRENHVLEQSNLIKDSLVDFELFCDESHKKFCKTQKNLGEMVVHEDVVEDIAQKNRLGNMDRQSSCTITGHGGIVSLDSTTNVLGNETILDLKNQQYGGDLSKKTEKVNSNGNSSVMIAGSTSITISDNRPDSGNISYFGNIENQTDGLDHIFQIPGLDGITDDYLAENKFDMIESHVMPHSNTDFDQHEMNSGELNDVSKVEGIVSADSRDNSMLSECTMTSGNSNLNKTAHPSSTVHVDEVLSTVFYDNIYVPKTMDLKPTAAIPDYLYPPTQCLSCGLRYTDTDTYTIHLDDHRRRDGARIRNVNSGLMGTSNQTSSSLGGGNMVLRREFFTSKKIQSGVKLDLKAPVKKENIIWNKTSPDCNLCNKTIKKEWDDEIEEWILKDGTKIGENEYAHRKCVL